MLELNFSEKQITYKSGVSVNQGPTRYDGEHWSLIASDLLCGMADVFEDVGIVQVGEPWVTSIASIREGSPGRWADVTSAGLRGKSVYGLSEDHGWLFVPNCREAVEDVMSWTSPYFRNGVPTQPLSIAFPGLRHLRERIDSRSWPAYDDDLHDMVETSCLKKALFTMSWGPTVWTLFPASIGVRQLLKLADPVVSRINAAYAD